MDSDNHSNLVADKSKMNNKFDKYTSALSKRVASFKEDSKEKSDIVMAYMKEDSPLKNGVTVLQKKMKEDTMRPELSETEEENSESKFRKLTQGLGKKIKDIKSDIVEIKDESLQSLSDLKEIYQEKAEQKKAILNSFTDEEVKNLRKGAQLPAQFSKQMNALYLGRRLAVVRFSIMSCRNLDRDLIKGYDGLFVKTAIGLERFKSKTVTVPGPGASSEPAQWNETSTLPRQSSEDKHFEVELFARNPRDTALVGRGQVDLATVSADCLSRVEVKLRDPAQVAVCDLELVLWMTGINEAEVAEEAEVSRPAGSGPAAAPWCAAECVGQLTVTVIQAAGLGSNKLQGSINPYCQLELENDFFRTNAEIKSKSPNWNKSFSFNIKDPFAILHVSVMSEKLNSVPAVLGCAAIRLSTLHPHTRTRDQQQLTWVKLKNRKLRKMANGDDPKIQLKLDYKQNTVKAAVSVFQNKESLLYEVPKPKFDRPKLLQNVNRIKNFLPKGSTINRYKQSYEDIIAWKEPARTVKYFVFYMFFVYYFNICWLPIFLFYILFINWKHKGSDDVKPRMKTQIKGSSDDEEEEEEEAVVEDEEKKSLMKSLDSLQKILLETQEWCGLVASYFERVSNLFHHEEPFLSGLVALLLLAAALVLFMLGLRNVLLVWGVNKFTKKLRDPNPVATNEIDNILMRVPDFEMVENSREL